MLASLMAAMKVPDLKKRITFLFGMLIVYVIGLHIPVPGVDTEVLRQRLSNGSDLLALFDVFTGGAFKKYAIFAMGIMPYINASIIMQLLTMAVPQLEAMQKEGAAGQKRIRLYTKWLTGVLAFFSAFGVTKWLQSVGAVNQGLGVMNIVFMSLILVAGTAFLMWMGEQITEHGIGNGISIVIFAGIVATLPSQIFQTIQLEWLTNRNYVGVIIFALLFIATIVFMVAVTQAVRKIPIQHVKRVVGNKMVGGNSSYLPLKVNSAGVIPIIFAVSIMYFPMTVANFLSPGNSESWISKFATFVAPGQSWFGSLLYAILIIFFTYFYTAVSFNVKDVSENLKKYGSFIPGIRPGKPTQEYLDKVLTRITLAGAIFLAIVALLQYYVPMLTNIRTFTLIGGTSLLIVVGVSLDTMQAIESHLLMRHYEGFIKK
ncbi:MAG: preprotein translocase subunit SecY [Abditibacteriota bacterium]|nr:preprotein translocase subunit SecY [Abditibacteriota bacterium]